MTEAITCTGRATVTDRTKASSTTALLIYYFLQTLFVFFFKHTNPNTNLKRNKEHYIYEGKSTDRQHQQGHYQYIAFLFCAFSHLPKQKRDDLLQILLATLCRDSQSRQDLCRLSLVGIDSHPVHLCANTHVFLIFSLLSKSCQPLDSDGISRYIAHATLSVLTH